MSTAINPYVDWLELPPSVALPNHYQLLGVEDFESDERAIKAAYYRRVARVSIHQSGVNAEICKDVFVRLAEAKDCLVDPDARTKYDAALRKKARATKATAQLELRVDEPITSDVQSASVVAQRRLGEISGASAGYIGDAVSPLAARGIKLPYQSNRARSPFDMISVMRSPEEILAEVVESRGLTAYQAKRFAEKNPDDLIIGPYLLEDELRQGSWGQVYKASRVSTGESVSLRILPGTFKDELTSLKTALRRAKEVPSQRFQRPIDCAEKQHIYLASHYIVGEDLRSLVERKGALQPAHAVYCVARIVENMAAAQQAKQLHLELRPSKIIVNRSGEVFIRDLAIANTVSQRKRHQANPGQMAQVLPTEHLHFLAPEVFLSDSLPSFQSDVYSIGCILFYLLTGKHVFPGHDALRIVVAHRETSVPSLLNQDASLPDLLDQCFRRMLSKKAGNRFSSYSQLHQVLKQVYTQLGVSAVSAKVLWKDVEEFSPLDSAPQIKVRRFRVGRLAIAAVGVFALTMAGAWGASQFAAKKEIPSPAVIENQPESPRGPEVLRSGIDTVPEVEAIDSFEIR